mgnify:CR=1 FL=1
MANRFSANDTLGVNNLVSRFTYSDHRTAVLSIHLHKLLGGRNIVDYHVVGEDRNEWLVVTEFTGLKNGVTWAFWIMLVDSCHIHKRSNFELLF